MFASKNHSHEPIFMYNSEKMLKFAFVFKFIGKKLHFLGGRIGLTRSKTANKLKGPYWFLSRQKLKAKVHDHRETELQRRSNIFPFFPNFGEVVHVRIFFGLSSDELVFKLSYELKMKILASLYGVLKAFFSFLARKNMSQIRPLDPITFFCCLGRFFFEFLLNFLCSFTW